MTGSREQPFTGWFLTPNGWLPGEDPNFLSWSGWIRDNLGDAAPKIYLAGWLNLSRHRRRMLEDRGVVSIDLAHHQKAQTWPEHQRYQFAIEWLLYTLETARPYDETMWPSLAQERKIVIPGHLEPVVPVDANRPQSHPDTERNTDSPLYGKESLERIKQVLKSWTHNRNIYPGWLMLPSGEQRFHLSRRTDEWEPPILSALPDLTPVERLFALRELAWRREILLEPITVDFVAAATGVLHSINCETKTVEGIEVTRDDWTEVREAWRVVALSLLTDARLEGNEGVFQKRLEALRPYSSEVPDVEHRVYHERCLWAMYSLDIAALNDLLDNWSVEHCDPAWMLRKAALLTEVGKHDESMKLVQDALNAIRKDLSGVRNIIGASREGWALAATLTLDNKQEVFSRWDELASLKCHAWLEIDFLVRAMTGTGERKRAPSFNLGSRQGARVSISNERRDRILAAYRAVRLPEVVGLPPVNRSSNGVPTAAASRILTLAADELVPVPCILDKYKK